MTIPRPSVSLLLDGATAGSAGGPLDAPQAGVRRVVVDLSVDEAHDRVELVLWRDSALASAAPGATLVVGLGYGDAVEDVLTVEVAGCDTTTHAAVLTGYARSRRLATTHVGRSFVDRRVGDVVSDLLSAGGVTQGTVDAPLRLPAFAVDPRRSAWATLHDLARRTGCQVTSDADGAVSFTPIPGAAGGGGLGGAATSAAAAAGLTGDELREGAELLAFRAGLRQAATAVAVRTGVAAQGGLLLASPEHDAEGPFDVDPSAPTREAAEAATAAREAAARRRARPASATVPGRTALRAGATTTVRGTAYRVLQARHVVDADAGYLCDLRLEGDR